MATLRELRKRLASISITKQLAGAMKTVSAAKYAKIETVLTRYKPYADTCRALTKTYGGAMTDYFPCVNPDAPPLYIVLSSNRGLCGGYNSELFRYVDEVLSVAVKPYLLIVCGKMADGRYGERAMESYTLPDVPDFTDCLPLFSKIRALYTGGDISTVTFLYEHFQNMLTQTPCSRTVLPFDADTVNPSQESDNAGTVSGTGDMLFYPDRETVLSCACLSLLNVSFYSVLLEAAAGAQAATLIAMRAANDNAAESATKLEIAISRKRQAEVTSSVIETASGVHNE